MVTTKRTAYICWALGGIFGLHHFYLGRDIQAFVWFVTFGGGLVGWFRDFRNIPKYVNEANGKEQNLAKEIEKLFVATGWLREALSLPKPRPNVTWTLSVRQILLGWLFSALLHYAIPLQLLTHLNQLFVVAVLMATPLLGTALGVFLASNFGQYKLPLRYCMNEGGFGWSLSAWASPWLAIVVTPFFAIGAANQHLDRATSKPHTNDKNLVKRCFTAAAVCVLHVVLVYYVVCCNTRFVANGGRLVTLQEVTSDNWAYYRRNGPQQLYADTAKFVDPQGKYRAYWTLGYRSPWMSRSDLKAHCRRLKAKWHPDMFSTMSDNKGKLWRDYAETKYTDTVNACDILMKFK